VGQWEREAQAVFIVRILLVFVALAATSGVAVAAVAKLIDPAFDAGQAAAIAAVPVSALLTAWVVRFRLR